MLSVFQIDSRTLGCTAATARDHRLAFNMRMFPPLEPSMASIEASPGDLCEGALYTLTRHSDPVYSVAFSPNGDHLASGASHAICSLAVCMP